MAQFYFFTLLPRQKNMKPSGFAPMRDNLSSYVCKKIVKKVDNQQKMIQKGVLLSCSYSRSMLLLPGSDA